ncbi:N-glycosylase/DNA lyase [Nanoarchaeota archaeon]
MANAIQCAREIRNDAIKDLVDRRLAGFKRLGRKSSRELFKELCFCILTANYSAEGGIRIQKKINNGFLTLSEKQLAKALKEQRYRFPNVRAGYIVEARKHAVDIKKRLAGFDCEKDARDWLARNVKGLGYKEASHFLRNVGYESVAIIDFHIIDFLVGHGLIEKPKTMTPKRYVEIENVLQDVADKASMHLGELDLYMWYCETGRILK